MKTRSNQRNRWARAVALEMTIRRIAKTILPAALALVVGGCDVEIGHIDNPLVPSLQPLYTEADLEFDPRLVGTWVVQNNPAAELRFQRRKAGKNSYALAVTEKTEDGERSAGFEAHLVRLGGYWFLDLYPNSPEGDDFYTLHLIRAHTFARVWIESDALRIGFFDSTWLKERIKEKSIDTEHQEIDGDVLLTAPTRDLQDLIWRYANEEKAFGEPVELSHTEEQRVGESPVPKEGR